MSRIKVLALLLSGAMLFTGIALEVKAQLKPQPKPVEQLAVLPVGHPYCVADGVMRLYDKALIAGNAETVQSLVKNSMCSTLDFPWQYELIDESDDNAKVRVALDDEHFEFWVSKESIR